MKQLTFSMAMRDYFGLKPDQTLREFIEEMKALTPEDREEFKKLLTTVGYQIVSA